MAAQRTAWLAPSAYAPHVGGIEETTRQLAHELQRIGWRIEIVTHRHPDDLPEYESVDGTWVHRVSFPSPKSTPTGLIDAARDVLPAARALHRIEPAPDLVHVHGASIQLPVLLAFTALRRVPLVVTTHGEVGADDHDIFDTSRYLRAALRAASLRAAALTAVSTVARDQAAAVAPRFADAAIIPNGVDPDEWPATRVPDEATFAAWGRDSSAKGFDVLHEAFAIVHRHRPYTRLLLGGVSGWTTYTPPGVKYLGPLDRAQVGDLLTSSRVVVVPSRVEAFGLVALEAMAAGRAVVWSDLPGLRAATGGLGYPVPPGDPAALADAMMTAMDAPPDPEPLRAHARTLSWSAAAARYAERYDEATAG